MTLESDFEVFKKTFEEKPIHMSTLPQATLCRIPSDGSFSCLLLRKDISLSLLLSLLLNLWWLNHDSDLLLNFHHELNMLAVVFMIFVVGSHPFLIQLSLGLCTIHESDDTPFVDHILDLELICRHVLHRNKCLQGSVDRSSLWEHAYVCMICVDFVILKQ